jgi:excisionase family DNA binding protein
MGRAIRNQKLADQPEPAALNHDERTRVSSDLPLHENLRPDEVARWLRCSTRHVRNLIDAGRLAASDVKVSTHGRQELRIKKQEAIDFMERSRVV